MGAAFPILLLFVLLSVTLGLPRPADAEKDRVKVQDLSDEKHWDEGEHNPEYDHEAFLGEKEAQEFDQLNPEESRERLALIVKKIDADNDGMVTSDELRDWIRKTQRRYIEEDSKTQWKQHNIENKGTMSWKDYQKIAYGFMEDQAEDDSEDSDDQSYKDMEARDKRRWDVADLDQDQALSYEEFINFLHPEEADHMREIVVEETMSDIDKDKDGKVSLDEYIGDMYGGEGGEEPDWVKNEREQFQNFRDKDGDGYMDQEEVMAWIMPPDYDHVESETNHLMTESDADNDGKLTAEEILDKYDLFVGSQATDFGEALTRHKEL